MTVPLLEILALEIKVWEALKTGNAELDAKMLANDFLGVYPTGFSGRAQHCDQLKNGPTVASYELVEPRLVILSDDQVLLSYLARWSRLEDSKAGPIEKMYISSIWKRRGQEWKNTFSQDTPAAG